MTLCDQGGCTARATREIIYDSGGTLWACAHHAASWYPDLPQDVIFDTDKATIWA